MKHNRGLLLQKTELAHAQTNKSQVQIWVNRKKNMNEIEQYDTRLD